MELKKNVKKSLLKCVMANSKRELSVKDWEIVLQSAIEAVSNGKEWWEVTDYQIYQGLLGVESNMDLLRLVDKIVDNIKI